MKRILKGTFDWRYAVGEVLLIVLGILIALGIDSLAGARSDQRQAAAYLDDLVLELRTDSADLAARQSEVAGMTQSARELLLLVQSEGDEGADAGELLIQSLFGSAIATEAAVWEELRATGNLRLIPSQSQRSRIVTHYLDRSARFGVITENFTPAVRALRAVAWDVFPVDAIGSFMGSGNTGVPSSTVLAELRQRGDTEFLLKRLVATSTVAQLSIQAVILSSGDLLATLES